MTTVAITSKVFRWAKDRANISNEKLARIIHTKPEKISAWETGKERPNFQQAQKLANTLSIPLGYLFLSQPPTIVSPIADFRTLPGKEAITLSLNLQDLLDDALRKRDWYRDWRKAENLKAFDFVGKFAPASNPDDVIVDMRHILDIPQNTAVNLRTWDEHLRLLIQKIETAGILVLMSGIVGNNTHKKLSLEDFRGFTLADEYAPLIFINSRDSIAGRIFTLAHELTHLWTGTSGISNPELSPSNEGLLLIEKYCNLVASEFLVPRDNFINTWNHNVDLFTNSQNLARYFRVSAQVVLRRSLDLGFIQMEEYFNAYKEIVNNIKVPNKPHGGNFYNNIYSRNSRRFTNTLIYALTSGHLSYQSASRLLNTKPIVVDKMIRKL